MSIILNGTTGITSTGITETSDGKVGIGTSSPDANHRLEVATGGTAEVGIRSGNTNEAILNFGRTSDRLRGRIAYNNSSEYMAFWANQGEKMRLDSSGSFMVGTTIYNPVSSNVIGFSVRGQYGETQICTDGAVSGAPLYLNRKTNDGSILEFRKDGTTVGSIQTEQSVSINVNSTQDGSLSRNGTIKYRWGDGAFYPNVDNGLDLGLSARRWNDVWAANGTIQTSDANEKQDIETLSEAETRVAVACKGLLRKFRWKDAVAKKGDEARIHFDIIAQDLQDAFAAEGLDAGRYAMFISSTWWEAERVVQAVEEVLDDEGNVTTEAVAEHTVTDTYATAEEAPEGATERTRLGVRYPELLAFIIGAL